VLSGAESWNDIADYGKAKHEWLKTFLTLPGGIPSHDTFNRVFAALDPLEMEKGYVAWVSSIAKLTAGEVVAIDGKALCGSRIPASGHRRRGRRNRLRHGWMERRRCSVIADLGLVEKAAEWPSLQGLVRIEAERYHKATGRTEREIRYYITRLNPMRRS